MELDTTNQQTQLEQNPPQHQSVQPTFTNQKGFIPVIIGIVILLIVVASGAYYLGQRSQSSNQSNIQQVQPTSTTHSNTFTPTATPQVLPANKPSTKKGWKTYESDKYGYFIDFPETWYNLPNYGAPDSHKYFSNQDVGAPLEMKSGGVWVTLSAQDESDYYTQLLNASLGIVSSGQKAIATKLSDLSINGNKAVKYISETAPGAATEYAYTINYAVKYNSQIFNISFVTFSKTDADKNIQLYDQMATSFRFSN